MAKKKSSKSSSNQNSSSNKNTTTINNDVLENIAESALHSMSKPNNQAIFKAILAE